MEARQPDDFLFDDCNCGGPGWDCGKGYVCVFGVCVRVDDLTEDQAQARRAWARRAALLSRTVRERRGD